MKDFCDPILNRQEVGALDLNPLGFKSLARLKGIKMPEQPDEQIMISYLLGALPEDETERLDERSVTDDEFEARLRVAETELVDAYARGELSGERLERFDRHYLRSPRRREKAMFAETFLAYGDKVSAARAIDAAAITQAKPADGKAGRRRLFRWSFFAIPRLTLQWGFAAAALLLLFVGSYLIFENLRLRNQMTQAKAEREELQKQERELQSQLTEQRSSDSEKAQELASLREQIARLERQAIEQKGAKTQPPTVTAEPNIIPFVLAPQTRGTSQIATISIPPDADHITMQLDLEPGDFASYRAELKARPGNEVVWRSGRLRARARGEGKAVIVTLRPMIFKSQIYILEVYGVSPTGVSEIIGSYPFRVVK